jgi:hypothetical protein
MVFSVCHRILHHVQLYACDVSEISRNRFNKLLSSPFVPSSFLSELVPACATSIRFVVFRGIQMRTDVE